MKLLILLALLTFAPLTYGQATNVHVAGTVSASGNLGFSSPSLGASAGFDLRRKRFAFSTDFDAAQVRKHVGGSGYEVTGRETVRFYFRPSVFIQGGVIEQHYKVTKFSKTAIEPLIGIGVVRDAWLIEANYRHDIHSENHQRIGEARITYYGPRHFFARGSFALASFVSGTRRQTGTGASLSIGAYF